MNSRSRQVCEAEKPTGDEADAGTNTVAHVRNLRTFNHQHIDNKETVKFEILARIRNETLK